MSQKPEIGSVYEYTRPWSTSCLAVRKAGGNSKGWFLEGKTHQVSKGDLATIVCEMSNGVSFVALVNHGLVIITFSELDWERIF